MPLQIHTDEQFWHFFWRHFEFQRFDIHDNPDEAPPAFHCMSDEGQFGVYVMTSVEGYDISPNNWRDSPDVTPVFEKDYSELSGPSFQCLLETMADVVHPAWDPDDSHAREQVEMRMVSGEYWIPVHCLNEEELAGVGLGGSGAVYMKCFFEEVPGGPSGYINAITHGFTGVGGRMDIRGESEKAEAACAARGITKPY